MNRDWESKFLDALATSPNVTAAARAAGIDRKTAYNRRHSDPEFAERWAEALESAVDDLVAEAFARARAGSDALTVFLLRAHRPEVYRESSRHEITGRDGGTLRVRPPGPDLSLLTDEELDWLERITLKLDGEAGREESRDTLRIGSTA